MNIDNIDNDDIDIALKTETLIEALPWLKRYHDRIIVVKFGGNAMVHDELIANFAADMAFLRYVGIKPVIVHGGGPQISAMLDRLGIPSEFRGGYRVTTPEIMDVVRQVLIGTVNKQLVRTINAHAPAHTTSTLASGLSGEETRLFEGQRREVIIDGETCDLGLVGDVVGVNPHTVFAEISAGRIPIISSIALDRENSGQSLNINADAAASALAVALGAAKLVILTNVKGLYRDWPRRESLISEITAHTLRGILPTLTGGMIPKMHACLAAVEGGVPKAAIIDGRHPHSILLEIFTPHGNGTEVITDKSPHNHAL